MSKLSERMMPTPVHGKNSKARLAQDVVLDRLRVAVRTLVAGGHPVDPRVALIGAGLELHHDRQRFAGAVEALAEEMAAQLAREGR